MAEVKWIKLRTDIFDDEKIQLIDGMPERDGILVIWFKLLSLAGKQNNGGVFMLNDSLAYTDEMLATIFRRPLDTVRLALSTFESFGMIKMLKGTVTIPNWDKHQSLDKIETARAKNRKKVASYRQKQKVAASSQSDCNGYSNADVTTHVTECNGYSNGYVTDDVTECNRTEVEVEREEEKDIEVEVEVEAEGSAEGRYGGDCGDGDDDKLVVFKDRVMLTENQLGDLLDKMGLEAFDEYVERLNEFILSRRAKIKNHYKTILKWYNEDRALDP